MFVQLFDPESCPKSCEQSHKVKLLLCVSIFLSVSQVTSLHRAVNTINATAIKKSLSLKTNMMISVI